MRNWKFLVIPMMIGALGTIGCTKTKKEEAAEANKEIRNEQKDVVEAQREGQKDVNEEKKDVIEAQKDVEQEKVEAQKEINQAPQ